MRALVLLLMASCLPKPSPSTAAETAYGAQLLACVDQAATLAESKQCRAKVNAAWGIDGGAK